MLKKQIIELAEKWGYILVYSDYSSKARSNVWMLKVPTTTFKNRPEFVRSIKILEDNDLEELLDKTKKYFAESEYPIKVILRDNKYSSIENDKELFIINNTKNLD
ncbi:hypothetical protein VF14_13450 [Nostoc linckia z18]|uniref:Uncharacterized protein n=2 Tax=Nostoc linckia TaxID=92942 RepID=A0A9Q5ZC19_NOSLI|nr:hypothetical protein [Nostoc linckia]PHK42275.1 hypothetical protein VF12_03715 [Nostoc linckia z15]PHK45482.1 hypothetical protein VF13_16165 [Nostoc linckia z16]PHJ59060.1 hypothetical protein VF02_26150 [Nostoc linckia z1]PHJ61913.1 hypothetical protein VF05_27845 [Nostoc linckia z3]PHJ67830.1 hypothetical protein VF03_25595 [Nostoc linckia z2]